MDSARGHADKQVGRAATLGAAGAVGAAALATVLAASAADQWVGWQPQEVSVGLSLLVTAAAATLSLWASVVLAAATASLLSRSSGVVGPVGRAPGGQPLTRRVASALLVLGSIGIAPAVANASETIGHQVGVVDPRGAAPGTGLDGEHLGGRSVGPGPTPAPALDPPEPPDLALPQPGWTPTRPAGTAGPSTDVGLVSTAPSELLDRVVVHRGDTLWGLAASHLGDRATDADVAEEWPRWYAANRDVIGEDPDLLLPGQQLVVPSTGGHR